MEVTKAKSLVDFSKEIMEKIVKEVDFQAIQALRKTAPDLRNYIDDSTHFKFNLNVLSIDARPNAVTYRFVSENSILGVEYRKHPNGCMVTSQKNNGETRKKFVENGDYMVMARNDLKLILSRHGAVLREFNFSAYVAADVEFIRKLKEDLKDKLIETKYVDCSVGTQELIVPILELIDPKHFNKLRLCKFDDGGPRRLNIENFAGVEIWSRPMELSVEGFIVWGQAAFLSHMKIGQMAMSAVNINTIRGLTQVFINSVDFDSCELHFTYLADEQDFLRQFGFPYANGPVLGNEIRSWFFHIPNTETAIYVGLHPDNRFLFQWVSTLRIEEFVIFNDGRPGQRGLPQ